MLLGLRQQTQQLQASVSQAQQELATGRIADPSRRLGAPFGTVQAMRGEAIVARRSLEAYRLTASRLDAVAGAMSQLRDIAAGLQAAAFSGGGANPALISDQARAARSDMMGAMNVAPGGVFLFGGENSAEAPWSRAAADLAGEVTRHSFFAHFGIMPGDEAARSISADAMRTFLDGPLRDALRNAASADLGLRASDAGRKVLFDSGVTAAGWPSAADSSLRSLVAGAGLLADLGAGDFSEGAAAAVRETAMKMLGESLAGLVMLQAQTGQTQARLTESRNSLERTDDRLTEQIAEAEVADPYETQTRLSALMVQLEMSYQMTARIARMSLGNYL
jgi:flagellar hook-associated protein 3 FlgL